MVVLRDRRLELLRRISILATLALALTVAPAYAGSHYPTLRTQMAAGAATSSRQSGGCNIASANGALTVSCQGRATATLVYTFSSGRYPVHGLPMGWPYAPGNADVEVSTKASGHTIHLTLTVARGGVTIHGVCVSYYA